MKTHISLFFRANKVWIAKAIFILFAFITLIVYFADFYDKANGRCVGCHSVHPTLVCLGILTATFTACSLVIFVVQFHKSRGGGYVHLDLDEDGRSTKKAMYSLGENMMSSKLKSVLKWCSHVFTLLLSILILILMIIYASFEAKTLPKINGELALHGLISDATIQREPDGVLHIKANNIHDMYFAQGVAMAQERLWEMEFNRRVGSGTLSEILGNATFSVDTMMRTFGFYHAALASLGGLNNASTLAVNSFVEGVNSYLDTKPPLPAEFHLLGFKPAPFAPVDAMLMVKVLSLELSGNYFREMTYHNLMYKYNLTLERISELVPEYPPYGPTVLSEEDIAHINFTLKPEPITSSRTFPRSTTKRNFEKVSLHEEFNAPKLDPYDIVKRNGILQGLNLGFKSASNNWVVGGNRTFTGKPLLCNDPHLTISAPSIWLLMHLECPEVSVIGATPVGAPGITIGRNADIAWGVTNTFNDVQDLYILEVNENNTSYFYNNTWLDFEYREEIIAIKGLPNYTLNVREAIYGPVMSDITDMQGQTAALRWTSLDDNDTTFEALVALSTAKNFDDFRNALRLYVAPSQNFIFADTAGNIGYQCPGRIPVRVPGHTGMIPVPGNGSYDWVGWIPYDELPYVMNPSKGYLASANNKIVPDSYPYLLLNNHDWDAHFRILSIVTLINSTNDHTVKSMQKMQQSTLAMNFIAFLPFLAALNDSMLDANARVWKNKLLNWDGNETPESQEATVFEFWDYYLGRMGGAETGTYAWPFQYFILDTLANETSPVCDGSCNTYATKAFAQAVKSANNRQWGEVHHLYIEHSVMSQSAVACFFDRMVITGGNDYTINLGAFDSSLNESVTNPFASYAGPSYRQVVDLANMDNSQFIIPMGNSGNLLDKHYDNMLQHFLVGEYYPMKMANYKVADTVKVH